MPGSRAWRKLSEDVNFIKRIGYQDRCSIKVTTATPCGLYFPICYTTLSSRADQNPACRMRGRHQSKDEQNRPQRTEKSSRRRKSAGYGGRNLKRMSIPHALLVKVGGFQVMTEYPERGHLTYKVKNRKSQEGEEKRAFSMASGTRNVELRTARHIQ